MEENDKAHYIADYLKNGKSGFEQDNPEAIRAIENKVEEEATELKIIWDKLDDICPMPPNYRNLDYRFYMMLQEQSDQKDRKTPTVRFILSFWYKIAAGVFLFAAAGIAMVYWKSNAHKHVVILPAQHSPLITADNKINSGGSAAEMKNRAVHVSENKKVRYQNANQSIQSRLHSSYVSQRLAAIGAIAENKRHKPQDLVRLDSVLLTDESSNVRFAVVDALRPLSKIRSAQSILISAMLGQHDELVRRYIIELLLEAKASAAIPAMTSLLTSRDLDPLTESQIRDGLEVLHLN